jgi:hypothetical protein
MIIGLFETVIVYLIRIFHYEKYHLISILGLIVIFVGDVLILLKQHVFLCILSQ